MPRPSGHLRMACGGATTCGVHPLVRDPSRVVALAGADNFRDLGGYPIPGGGEVARGLVYRSDGLQSLTDDDLRIVEERGITTVIDLRHQREFDIRPSRLPSSAQRVSHCLMSPVDAAGKAADVRQAARESGDGHDMLEVMYTLMIDHSAQQFADVITAIADADAPLLFHCHGGKDRTGLVAAFVLELLGVERELVLDDYVLTSELRVADADAFRDLMDDGLSAAAAAGVLGAPRELMVSVLGRLDTEHGGAGGYLRDVGGLDDTVISRLRDRLVKL